MSTNYCCNTSYCRLSNYTSGALSVDRTNCKIQRKLLSVPCSDRPTKNIVFVDKTQHQHCCSSNLLEQLPLFDQARHCKSNLSLSVGGILQHIQKANIVIKTAIALTKGRNFRLHIHSVSFVLLCAATI